MDNPLSIFTIDNFSNNDEFASSIIHGIEDNINKYYPNIDVNFAFVVFLNGNNFEYIFSSSKDSLDLSYDELYSLYDDIDSLNSFIVSIYFIT